MADSRSSSQSSSKPSTPSENAELYGIITSTVPGKRDEKIKRFSVKSHDTGKTYKCEMVFFAPLIVGDVIYATVKLLENGTVRVVLPPYIETTVSKEDTKKCFITLGKFGYVTAGKIYDNLAKRCEEINETEGTRGFSTEESVAMYLNNLAEKWRDAHDESILKILIGAGGGGIGIDTDKAKMFLSKWHKQKNMRRLYLLGMTRTEINKCDLSTDEIYERCKTNPLTLCGIDIKKAIEIMGRLNMVPSGEDIMCGKIMRYVYDNNMTRGWMGTPTRIMMKTYPDFPKYKDKLESEYYMVAELHTVYLLKHATYEHKAARYINELMRDNREIIDHPFYPCDRGDIMLNEKQKSAVKMALSTGISVITGGAGTGKTTIISNLLQNLELLGLRYLLTAFTGKACNVIKKSTGRNAFTIHRLLSNIHNYVNREEGVSMIIIDEASMVTTELFCKLMTAIDFPDVPFPKVVLVGDVNQLPPIEAGTLMYEVMKINEIPSTFLTDNMRVEKRDFPNGIIINAEKIVSMSESDRGVGKKYKEKKVEEPVDDFFDYGGEFDPFNDFDPDDIPNIPAFNPVAEGEFEEFENFFMTLGNMDLVYDVIIEHHKKGGSQEDLTIISPYNRDLKALNEKFQQIYHSEDPHTKDHWGTVWYQGDRVMVLENNEALGISNGETALVANFDDKMLHLIFNKYKVEGNKVVPIEKVVELPMFPTMANKRVVDADLDETMTDEYTTTKITHGYAISVHKSQGSGWAVGVIYLPPESRSSSFINRNMIYTAITRFSQTVHVIGNIYAFQASIDVPLPYRHDTLGKRIALIRSGKGHTSKVHSANFFERNSEGVVGSEKPKMSIVIYEEIGHKNEITEVD